MAGDLKPVITEVRAREVLDSRGLPTVEAEVVLSTGQIGSAIVPAGASRGKGEAKEKRDRDQSRWEGEGVLTAVAAVEREIAPILKGIPADPKIVDSAMLELDGTPDKNRLGANAILAVSLATARAAAIASRMPLFLYISHLIGQSSLSIPTPMVNIISGGHHASWRLDVQDYLVIPYGAQSLREALDWVGRIYHGVRRRLSAQGHPTLLADEGGFSFPAKSNEEPLSLLTDVIQEVGLTPLRDVALGIDVAASHFFLNSRYRWRLEGEEFTSRELAEILFNWLERYPIISVEDGMAEDDLEGWDVLSKSLRRKAQLIGDDLFVTNPTRIKWAAEKNFANAVLIKPNQAGTLTETLQAHEVCREVGYNAVVSARSGDTEDTFIADLAVGLGVGQIKIGSIARSERTAKYNRLLRLEEQLSGAARYAGALPFRVFARLPTDQEGSVS